MLRNFSRYPGVVDAARKVLPIKKKKTAFQEAANKAVKSATSYLGQNDLGAKLITKNKSIKRMK